MTASRPSTGDLALLLLAVLTLVPTVQVVTRTPGALERPAASATVATPAGDPRPHALFVGSGALADVAAQVSDLLGWELSGGAAVLSTGYVAGGAGQTFDERLPPLLAAPDVDVVFLMSSGAAGEETDARVLGGRAQQVAAMVRAAHPAAELVLVAPVSPDPDAARVQREVLTGVAARFGAYFVDPVGRRYVQDRPGVLTGDGALTPAGAELVARRLAADLRVVLPATVLPAPAVRS